MKVSEITQPNLKNLPPEVLQAAKTLHDKVAHNSMLCGDSAVVSNYWIETHTIGCRNAADDPEETWWDRHQDIYNEYISDGKTVVVGDPSDGVFVTITPQRSTDTSSGQQDT